MKLIMTKGLPASGKSTWAKEQVLNSGGKTKRVNKDDLRAMIDGGKWSKQREKEIIEIRDNLVYNWLKEDGYDVIVDDTNLAPKHETNLKRIAESVGAIFEIKSFLDVPLTVCIERDLRRGDKSVGKDIINRMYYDHIFKPPLASDKGYIDTMQSETPFDPCIIVDIDGTIAFKGNRNPYDLIKVKEDKFNYALWNVIKHFPYAIVFLSGREGTQQCERDTREWLEKHTGMNDIILLMRKEKDNRSDYIIKEELLKELVDKAELIPIMVFDDRDQVVDMWRSHGIFTAQVNYGGF